jgi:integrase
VLLPHPLRRRPQPWTPVRISAWQRNGDRPVVAVWTPKHLAAFLAHAREDWLFALWWLTALRGLRRGELCALRWTVVDLDTGTLTISRQLTRANHRLHVAPPKTRAGERTIALDTATVAVLRQHQRRQRLLARATDAEALEYGLVFCWPDSRPLSPDWLTHRFHHLVTASGLPPVRLHDLRHGAATLAQTAHTDRRERRRKLILGILIAVVFLVADAVGLWALNQTQVDSPLIFNWLTSVDQHKPTDGSGPP